MQVINIKDNVNQPIMIFKNVFDNGVSYSTTISHKNVNDEYENAFINVRFRKDVDVENKSKIIIKNAWLDFYQNKDGKDIIYIFINEFDLVK